MDYATPRDFADANPALPSGPVTVLLCESAENAQTTARRTISQGTRSIIAVGQGAACLEELDCHLIRIAEDPRDLNPHQLLNDIFSALAERWVLWLWNGEFFFYPYCENRTLRDLAEFLESERRRSIFTYALDLYGDHLPGAHDDPSDLNLSFDRLGYHAFPEQDQRLKLYGSLGWRFEELCPLWMQQIGRASYFKVAPDLSVTRDLQIEDAAYASVSCPWHRNPTAAMMSLRRTRRIFANPKFPGKRSQLYWRGTAEFDWSSHQLLELGMIEPGQWF
jgi:hypothetical protein